ncbi:MAG: aminodeoxychorismate lyase [Pseudomonadales bacterium]
MTTELPKTLVNGKPGDTLSVYDRGTAYGHGVFETVRVRNGCPELWRRHLQRLLEGCSRLAIQLPVQFESALNKDIAELCGQGVDGVIKIIITAGSGGRGYLAPQEMQCQRVVSLFPMPAYPDLHSCEGVQIRTCDYRLAANSRLAGIKHLNRLDQVMARAEWQDSAIAEGIVLDAVGNVIEGTMSNLFAVKNGELLTPSLDECGVRGVMRSFVLDTADAMGIKTREVSLTLDEFKSAQELFLTNSVIGVWPVKQWDAQHYVRGAVTQRLQQKVEALCHDAAGDRQ